MLGFRCWIGKGWGGDHRLLVIQDHAPGKVRVSSGFTWDEYDEGGLFDHQAGIPAADSLIQSILDKAWDAGFRPAGFSDVKNETVALRDHLSDLRQIAFKKLGIDT